MNGRPTSPAFSRSPSFWQAAPIGWWHEPQGMRWRCRRGGLGGLDDGSFCGLSGGWVGRQRAAADTRACAVAKISRSGQLEASAIFTRRTEIVTSAPIFSSLRRMVPQVATASAVPTSAIRRRAHMRT